MRRHASHFGIILSGLIIFCNSWAQTSAALAVEVTARAAAHRQVWWWLQAYRYRIRRLGFQGSERLLP